MSRLKLRGIIGSILQIGNGGPQLEDESGAIAARDASDAAYARMRAATPVSPDDVATKRYADTLSKPIVASAEFDGNDPLPGNSGVEHFYVVTTTGANAAIGTLLFDDGTGVGTVTVLPAVEGRTIFTTALFNTGTVTLLANSFYVWDTTSGSWLLESSVVFQGVSRIVRYHVTEAGAVTQDSATSIDGTAVVLACAVTVTTPWSAGGTLAVGRAGSASLLQTTTDNTATVAGTYETVPYVLFGATGKVRATNTAGAGPAAGAADVVVVYGIPDA